MGAKTNCTSFLRVKL